MQKPSARTLSELLLALRRKLAERGKILVLKNELSMTQFEVLWLISRSAAVSMDTIAERLNIKPPSVTALITVLERKGYIKRLHDSNDRRVVNLTLTPSAKRQIASMKKRKDLIVESLLSKLSKVEREEFIRLLTILTED